MSRIGKKPIIIPQGVEVKRDGLRIHVRGPKGELFFTLRPEIDFVISGSEVNVSEAKVTKGSKALWGTTRTVINNLIQGVHSGFEKKLEIHGLGYRASVEAGKLILSLGYSHPVEVVPPEGVSFSVEKSIVTISGSDKVLVGNMAHYIRSLKKPEPYKGKGIRYLGEVVRKKAGKKAVAASK